MANIDFLIFIDEFFVESTESVQQICSRFFLRIFLKSDNKTTENRNKYLIYRRKKNHIPPTLEVPLNENKISMSSIFRKVK
jgi:hypothetical protein